MDEKIGSCEPTLTKSEISNVCNAVEGHCFDAMKIMHYYANSCFDWLISGHQSVNPSSFEFLYCLANTKDLRLSILWTQPKFPIKSVHCPFYIPALNNFSFVLLIPGSLLLFLYT